MSVRLTVRTDNSKTNDRRVFELDIGNDLGMIKWYDFGVKRLKVKVTGSQSAERRSSGWRKLCTLSSAQPLHSEVDWLALSK